MQMLRRRMTQHERARLHALYDKIPRDIQYLTRTEAELKRSLVECIDRGEDHIQMAESELKRLRRESMAFVKQVEECQGRLEEQSCTLEIVKDR